MSLSKSLFTSLLKVPEEYNRKEQFHAPCSIVPMHLLVIKCWVLNILFYTAASQYILFNGRIGKSWRFWVGNSNYPAVQRKTYDFLNFYFLKKSNFCSFISWSWDTHKLEYSFYLRQVQVTVWQKLIVFELIKLKSENSLIA